MASISSAAPSWSEGPTVKRIGAQAVVISCRGSGIARDLSYSQAKANCTSLALGEISSEIKTKNVIIESETQTPKLYSETVSNNVAKGLAGTTEKELTESAEGGFTTYLVMKFDLSTVSISAAPEEPEVLHESSLGTQQVKDETSAEISVKRLEISSARTITIQMIPEKCADLIVRGRKPRSYQCNSNPMQVMVDFLEDDEIILRPTSPEFMPQTIKIHKARVPANQYESVDAQFKRK